MAYKKYRIAKKKTNKVKSYYGRSYGTKIYRTADTAMRAYSLASKLARMVNVEYKVNRAAIGSVISNTGIITNLTVINQGGTYQQRIGDSIKPMRLSGRLGITMSPSATDTTVRLILFRAKQENENPPAVLGGQYGYLDNVSGGLTYLAPKSWPNRFHFKTIYDKLITLNHEGKSSYTKDWDFKLYGHVNYAPGQTDIEDGGLYLLMVSNENSNMPTIQFTYSLTFTDN